MSEESKTVGDWLREAAYIQRNGAWVGWSGALRLVDIKHGLIRLGGFTEEGFYGWLKRINDAITAKRIVG